MNYVIRSAKASIGEPIGNCVKRDALTLLIEAQKENTSTRSVLEARALWQLQCSVKGAKTLATGWFQILTLLPM